MKEPSAVMALFERYRPEFDDALRSFLERQGTLPAYGMMRYFMGFADEAFRPTSSFGGKRFRSGLLLLISDFFGAKDRALDAAVSLELFHNFTLIHDDIVDHDEMRRGRPTVWKLWGVDQAINTGDMQSLLACQKLMESAKQFPDTGIPLALWLIARYVEVGEGQHLDFLYSDESIDGPDITREAYLTMTRKKTAVLVGAATKAAALSGARTEEEGEQLWRYGISLGLAYQLCDDAMGIWGDADRSGKVPHSDIRGRKKTLPVLDAYAALSSHDRHRFKEWYDAPAPLSDDSVNGILSLIDSTDARARGAIAIKKEGDAAKTAALATSLTDAQKRILCDVVDALLPTV